MDERLQIFQDKMEKSLANLNEEFAGIRAGRANPHVLDKLRVDYYGTPSPIQSVANVSVPEPRMIQIQPWEASMVKEIEKAILSSDLGINPTNDGKLIRLVFPELTEERRKELAKDIKKKGFTEDSNKTDFNYSAKDKDGNQVTVVYFQEAKAMQISVVGASGN